MKNSLLGKCGHLVRAKQRWDVGDVKLGDEGLSSERERFLQMELWGRLSWGFPVSALQTVTGDFSIVTVLGVHSFQEMKAPSSL